MSSTFYRASHWKWLGDGKKKEGSWESVESWRLYLSWFSWLRSENWNDQWRQTFFSPLLQANWQLRANTAKKNRTCEKHDPTIRSCLPDRAWVCAVNCNRKLLSPSSYVHTRLHTEVTADHRLHEDAVWLRHFLHVQYWQHLSKWRDVCWGGFYVCCAGGCKQATDAWDGDDRDGEGERRVCRIFIPGWEKEQLSAALRMKKTKQNNESECSLTQSLAERLEEGKDNKDNQGQERKKYHWKTRAEHQNEAKMHEKDVRKLQ